MEDKIKKTLSKIFFWIFCISMILSYYVGLAYPIETNFWLVKNGVPIIILELLSIFATISLLGVFYENHFFFIFRIKKYIDVTAPRHK